MRDNLYEAAYGRRFTDLPLLVRAENLRRLRAEEVVGTKPATPKNQTKVVGKGDKIPPPGAQTDMLIGEEMRQTWGDFIWWNRKSAKPEAISRDEVGKFSQVADPLLEGSVEVTLKDGKKIACRPIFDVIAEYAKHFDPKTTEEITWAPAPEIESLAREIAKVPGTTLFAIGMGPNQFFNNDNKDRTQFLLAALTGNIGKLTGNIGSYAGNYRGAMFNGVAQYINENPVDIALDRARPARPKQHWRPDAARYY